MGDQDAGNRQSAVNGEPDNGNLTDTGFTAPTIIGDSDSDVQPERPDTATVIENSTDSDANAPSAGPDLEPGTVLGKYEVRRKLGAGAMGAVYLAFDPMIEREVAVKVLPPDFASRPNALDRFLTEARATGKLNHPNVVAIHDIGVQDELHYIVMEMLRGGSVLNLIETSEALPWEEACRIIADAAEGLAAAHAADLIHRDIKPENLMLTAEGTVKIVDFGLAKLIDTAGDPQNAVTRMGQVMGTPQFMSPEQFAGTDIDYRCDIYGLGGSLYQMLTGNFPYDNCATIVQLMYAHLEQPVPDPTQVNSDIPPGCRDVIARAMAKKAADRYQDAAEMARDLRSIVSGQPARSIALIDSQPTSIREEWRTFESVCIIEPSKMQALMLRDFLTKAGVTSIDVNELADTAIGPRSQARVADVVVTSMHVPDMSGVEIIKQLRSDRQFDQSMLVLNSSDSTVDDLIDAGQSGALALVSKKTKPEEILRAVHACSFLNARSASFDAPIDPLSLRVLFVGDDEQIPDSVADLIRRVGLLDIESTTHIKLATGTGPNGRFDLAIVLRTAGRSVGDTKLFAGLLPAIESANQIDVGATAAVQIDGDSITLRALAHGGFTAVTTCPLDETRLTRILQIV
jgi:serine/threonine protein kinase